MRIHWRAPVSVSNSSLRAVPTVLPLVCSSSHHFPRALPGEPGPEREPSDPVWLVKPALPACGPGNDAHSGPAAPAATCGGPFYGGCIVSRAAPFISVAEAAFLPGGRVAKVAVIAALWAGPSAVCPSVSGRPACPSVSPRLRPSRRVSVRLCRRP